MEAQIDFRYWQSGHGQAFGGMRLKTPIAYFQLVNLTRYNACPESWGRQ
jgi:hypothetical protein